MGTGKQKARSVIRSAWMEWWYGRINAIAFHPDHPDTIYAGAPAGGLWVSIDNAATWEPQTDGLPSPASQVLRSMQ
jgi:hypothetical protein